MDPDPALAVRTIVLPLDGLASSERVFPFAARLASAFRARLVLLRALGSVNPALSHDAVLVALDGSKFAEAALRPALGLAGALGGSLLLLRVANAHERAAAETYLTEVARDPAGSGPSIDRQVAVAPSASSAILETVHARHIGLLVMATHGRGGFLRAVLGSVAGETVALADVPVLLVRPQHSIQ